MRHIKLFEEYSGDLPYEDWEKGIIKAWGHLLYLSYHNVPQKLDNLVSMEHFEWEFGEYLKNSDEDEELRDWMSGTPPTYIGGLESLYDRNRMDEVLQDMASRTKLNKPLMVYRYEKTEGEGWNSFTTNPDLSYTGTRKSYLLPKGTPVIFTGDLADKDEVIVNLSRPQKTLWKV